MHKVTETLLASNENMEWYSHFAKPINSFFEKLKMYLSPEVAILLLRLISNKTQISIHVHIPLEVNYM